MSDHGQAIESADRESRSEERARRARDAKDAAVSSARVRPSMRRRKRLTTLEIIHAAPPCPWLGPPPHSHRIKNKVRARRMRGGR